MSEHSEEFAEVGAGLRARELITYYATDSLHSFARAKLVRDGPVSSSHVAHRRRRRDRAFAALHRDRGVHTISPPHAFAGARLDP